MKYGITESQKRSSGNHSIKNCWKKFCFTIQSIVPICVYVATRKTMLFNLVIYRLTTSTECRCILSKMLSHMKYSDYTVRLLRN